ncbi:unnamed protein product, partial [Rhizoctonia solani]
DIDLDPSPSVGGIPEYSILGSTVARWQKIEAIAFFDKVLLEIFERFCSVEYDDVNIIWFAFYPQELESKATENARIGMGFFECFNDFLCSLVFVSSGAFPVFPCFTIMGEEATRNREVGWQRDKELGVWHWGMTLG